MKHRVRSIIPNIDHESLIELGILDEDIFNEDVPKKSVPKWSLKNSSAFGFFVENIIRTAIIMQQNTELSIKEKEATWYNYIPNIFFEFYSEDYKELPFDLSSKICHAYYFSIWHFVKTELKPTEINYNFDIELTAPTCNQIIGHPDLISRDTIFDIKTTQNFKNMRSSTILQLVSYACLSNNSNIKYISVILPLTKQILKYELNKINKKEFIYVLNTTLGLYLISNHFLVTNRKYIGSHVGRNSKTSLKTLLMQINYPLFQIFLASPRGNTGIDLKDHDIEEIKNRLISQKYVFYVHSSYLINLATKDNTNWSFYILKNTIDVATKLGAKGVVVHIGANSSKKEGCNHMLIVLEKLCEYISEDTPLLLETNAAEGNDLLTNFYDLVKFYELIQNKNKIKICVDTQHIFSAGYLPFSFIDEFIKIFGSKSIPLIHFNDSVYCKGCKKDRHAYFGNGEIGVYELSRVMGLAIENNIDLIYE